MQNVRKYNWLLTTGYVATFLHLAELEDAGYLATIVD